jgi:hypothetical protein
MKKLECLQADSKDSGKKDFIIIIMLYKPRGPSQIIPAQEKGQSHLHLDHEDRSQGLETFNIYGHKDRKPWDHRRQSRGLQEHPSLENAAAFLLISKLETCSKLLDKSISVEATGHLSTH